MPAKPPMGRIEDIACDVVQSTELAPGYAYIGLRSMCIAEGVRPGQFVNVSCRDGLDPLLRRPVSVASVDRAAGIFWLFVKSVGRGSRWLTQVSVGTRLAVLGPLGRGFAMPEPETQPILVGGGVGVAPILMLAEELARRASEADGGSSAFAATATAASASPPRPLILLGASCEDELFLVEALQRCGEVRLATDDGSCGREGFVTNLLDAALLQYPQARVYTCGPQPMMREVARLAASAGLVVEVSMEAHMACGVGACLVCVCATKGLGYEKYKRVCADGPVFSGEEVDWDA